MYLVAHVPKGEQSNEEVFYVKTPLKIALFLLCIDAESYLSRESFLPVLLTLKDGHSDMYNFKDDTYVLVTKLPDNGR